MVIRILSLLFLAAIFFGVVGSKLANHQITMRQRQKEFQRAPVKVLVTSHPPATLDLDNKVIIKEITVLPSIAQPAVSPKFTANQSDKGKWEVSADAVHRLIRVDLALQRLFVYEDDVLLCTFKCSTSVTKKVLPWDVSPDIPHDHIGVFSILAKEPIHFSKKGVKMPHALKYWEGHFIHATEKIDQLGRPASDGCVRLHPRDAKQLYSLVQISDVVEIR